MVGHARRAFFVQEDLVNPIALADGAATCVANVV